MKSWIGPCLSFLHERLHIISGFPWREEEVRNHLLCFYSCGGGGVQICMGFSTGISSIELNVGVLLGSLTCFYCISLHLSVSTANWGVGDGDGGGVLYFSVYVGK